VQARGRAQVPVPVPVPVLEHWVAALAGARAALALVGDNSYVALAIEMMFPRCDLLRLITACYQSVSGTLGALGSIIFEFLSRFRFALLGIRKIAGCCMRW
jgi:hypothetical protein